MASCAGYFTMGLFHEPAPIYQLQQEVSLAGNQHVLWCVLLGALASLGSPVSGSSSSKNRAGT